MSLPVSVGKGIELSDMKAYLRSNSTVRDQLALLKRWISLCQHGGNLAQMGPTVSPNDS
jgi:hypothetical protein